MRRFIKAAGVAVMCSTLGFGIAACSGSTPAPEPASPSSSLIGADPATYTPAFFEVSNSGTTLNMIVGQAGILKVDAVSTSISGTSVVFTDSDAMAMKAAEPGTSQITAETADGSEFTWTVEVTEKPAN